MIGSLNRVILFVNDMPACAAFYRDTLGLQPHGYADEGWMSFDAGGCLISLHRTTQPAASNAKAVQIVFRVGDVDAARDALIRAGARMGDTARPEPGLSFCDGQDPAGNWFQISSR